MTAADSLPINILRQVVHVQLLYYWVWVANARSGSTGSRTKLRLRFYLSKNRMLYGVNVPRGREGVGL